MRVRHALTVALLAAGLIAAPGAAGRALAAPPDCPAAAATPAAALAAARSCGRRVEAMSGRTEAAQVFANPDGTSTMELATVPQRVHRKDGSWAAVDPTLRPGPGGALVPVASTLDVRFSGGGDAPLVTVVRGGREVTLGWPAPLPKPTVASDTATYPEVLPGVDLVLRATADGFIQVLVVKSAAAAANPALREIAYPVSGRGVTLAENGQGGFTATDPAGAVVVQSGGAAMWDSTLKDATSGNEPWATRCRARRLAGGRALGWWGDRQAARLGLPGRQALRGTAGNWRCPGMRAG
jgi:hypothetical protein